jgi:hypothetical protein
MMMPSSRPTFAEQAIGGTFFWFFRKYYTATFGFQLLMKDIPLCKKFLPNKALTFM